MPIPTFAVISASERSGQPTTPAFYVTVGGGADVQAVKERLRVNTTLVSRVGLKRGQNADPNTLRVDTIPGLDVRDAQRQLETLLRTIDAPSRPIESVPPAPVPPSAEPVAPKVATAPPRRQLDVEGGLAKVRARFAELQQEALFSETAGLRAALEALRPEGAPLPSGTTTIRTPDGFVITHTR